MKNITASLCATFAALPLFGLTAGDPLDIASIQAADFIQGDSPENWEDGKLYMLECWATWCGPCLEAIPHVDALYDKYHAKGLNVIGMNVWEDDKDKIAEFVRGKGDGMSYPVAYVGKGGAFENDVLKPAGVGGIPHALLVKDGKLLLGAHPASLQEDFIAAILEGGEAEEKAVSTWKAEQGIMARMQPVLAAFGKASMTDDSESMKKAITEAEAINPDFYMVKLMKLDHAMLAKEWSEVGAIIASLDGQLNDPQYGFTVAIRTGVADEVPSGVVMPIIAALSETPSNHPLTKPMQAWLQWKAGMKDDALATIKTLAANPGELPPEPVKALSEAYEAGEPQSLKAFINALNSASRH